MNTRVSVIIPNLDMGRFLPDALASIARQAVPVDEIFIVDAGSGDDSLAVIAGLAAADPRVRLLRSEAKNPSAVRNRALAAATGEVIAFLDADDLWPADKLARQLARLEAEPAVSVVSGFVQYFDRLDRERLAPAADSRVETLFHVHLGAAVFRRSVFDAVGGFDETLRYSEDVDLLLRIREEDIPMTILRARTLYYRRHDDSLMAQSDPAKERDFKRTLAGSLMRRRRKGVVTPLAPFETLIEPESHAD
ncbi:MAG: glycosyltransferase family 2 protein [Thiobacillus sp.]|nr:glycosyltransferase family 2 protein [Thiobacillus sp.]